jgi:hypothetical protein
MKLVCLLWNQVLCAIKREPTPAALDHQLACWNESSIRRVNDDIEQSYTVTPMRASAIPASPALVSCVPITRRKNSCRTVTALTVAIAIAKRPELKACAIRHLNINLLHAMSSYATSQPDSSNL